MSPTASPPLRWDWVREWWRIFGPVYGAGGQGLRIITVRRGPELIGVLPLYEGVKGKAWLAIRRLGFVSTGAAEFEETCAEYLDLLHGHGAAAECLAAIEPVLRSSPGLHWDELELSDVSEQSPLLNLKVRPSGRNRPASDESEICYFSDLSGGYEAYLGRLSKGARAEARRLLREADRAGMVFEIAADERQAHVFFEEMILLHRQRWASAGKTGSFAVRHAEFHRRIAELLVPRGSAFLARLSLKGEPFAVTYGHRVRETYHCYQRGVSLQTEPVRSPGTALLLRLMAHLAEHGVTRYDHLKGSNLFKDRFATGQRRLAHVRIVRPGLRSAVMAVFDRSRCVVRKARGSFSSILGSGACRTGDRGLRVAHSIQSRSERMLSLSSNTDETSPGPDSCTVDVVGDSEGLDKLETEWKALFQISPTASPPLRWEWAREWWRIFGPVYGDQGRGLRVITLRREARLVGILPLYLRVKHRSVFGSRRLGFVSTGLDEFEETCAEYLDLLHAPGEQRACCQALAHALLRSPCLPFDELLLSGLGENSALLALRDLLADSKRRVLQHSPGVCHLFDMSGGFEAYLNRLSHENRRQARKMLREVDREGLRFEVAQDAQQARSFFEQMVELHRQRWTAVGEQGSFAPRHAEFHSTLAELLVPRGDAVLARLVKDEKAFAVVFGYPVRDKLHCYQQGVTQGIGRVRSPGTACWLLLMQRLASEGITVFDHLRGTTQFKERFGTGTAPLAEIHVTRPSMRLLVSGGYKWLGRGARKAWRTFPAIFGSSPGSQRPPAGSENKQP